MQTDGDCFRAAFLLACLWVLAVFGAAAGQAHLQPLLQNGKWPGFTRGYAEDVQVVGNRPFVASRSGGLQIIDVSNPASPVRLGGYETSGPAHDVAVGGNRIYVAEGAIRRGLSGGTGAEGCNPSVILGGGD